MTTTIRTIMDTIITIDGDMLLFAESLTGSQVALLGVLVAAVVLILRRMLMVRNQAAKRGRALAIQGKLSEAEEDAAEQLNQMEVRLHDYSREVEGRIESRMVLLQQMLDLTDREIVRLQGLLSESSGGAPQDSESSPDSRRSDAA